MLLWPKSPRFRGWYRRCSGRWVSGSDWSGKNGKASLVVRSESVLLKISSLLTLTFHPSCRQVAGKILECQCGMVRWYWPRVEAWRARLRFRAERRIREVGALGERNPNRSNCAETQSMENSILYTFSTIAQALGGAFALLSAFVLFRFQSLDASMLNASIGLRPIWKTPADLETYDTLRGLSVWPALNKAIDSQIARMTTAHEHLSFGVMATKIRLRAGQPA
jgi:hypothetical protein